MIISVWRYSHLVLAVSSFLLLTLASVTGIVLAVEAVSVKAQSYKVDDFKKITLAEALPVIREKYPDVQELKVDDNGFVILEWTTDDGDSRKSYIDPRNGNVLAEVKDQSEFYQWVTSLHRSLFLHETGRFLIGLTSFLLILITISGIILVVQRQQSFKRFYARIERGSFSQYYHVFFGRFALFPILIVAITGTWLSVVRFELIKEDKFTGQVDFDKIRSAPVVPVADFDIFRKTPLSQVQSVQFPFAEDAEEFFVVKLEDREITVNQLTGEVLLQQNYSATTQMSALSLRLHTGRSGMIWAIFLAITCGYILFFIYSGFVITFKRRANKQANKFKAEESRIVILVGSENGTTMKFARTIYKQLTTHGEKVHITDLDKYRLFPAMEQLIIMTSTYGLGDPPSNAHHFKKMVGKIAQSQNVKFSVLAFGSRTYADFCRFGIETDQLLNQQSWAFRATGVFTVDDRSPQDFSEWCTAWSAQGGSAVHITRDLFADHHKDLEPITVVHKTAIVDDAFLIRFRAQKKLRVQSGDLVAIYPKNDHRERLYSIGTIGKEIQLSVKLHEHGLGSSFLGALNAGAKLQARIVKNQHFHFPRRAKSVVMISNGTGIAPFLGMLAGNRRLVPAFLYCGFRTEASFEQYKDFLHAKLENKQLTELHLALSREGTPQYVTHLLNRDEENLAGLVAGGAVIMICGSLSMQKDVLEFLERVCVERLGFGVEALRNKGQVMSDCY